MKFVDITENYKVNIESIFSLERRLLPNKEACDAYDDNLQRIADEVAASPPDLMCNGEMYNPAFDPDAKTNPLYDVYAEQLKEWMMDRIGEQPPLYIYENYAILSTGLKVQLSDSKYEAIINAIENMSKD